MFGTDIITQWSSQIPSHWSLCSSSVEVRHEVWQCSPHALLSTFGAQWVPRLASRPAAYYCLTRREPSATIVIQTKLILMHSKQCLLYCTSMYKFQTRYEQSFPKMLQRSLPVLWPLASCSTTHCTKLYSKVWLSNQSLLKSQSSGVRVHYNVVYIALLINDHTGDYKNKTFVMVILITN